MQRFQENGSMNEAAEAPFEEAEYCDTTRRIVIVSPFPASLKQLVSELTTRCYDVLLFHNENDPIMPMLQYDLMIVDRTKGATAEKHQIGSGNKRSMLLLVNDQVNFPSVESNMLIWPCPIEAALSKIEELAGRNTLFTVPDGSDQLRIKDVVLDLKRMNVHRAGIRIDLTKTEFDLLKVLLSTDGGVLTRHEIMELIWGDGYFGGSNSVDVHIKSLRQKLGDDPKDPQYIVTVRGVGYRIAD